MFADPVILIAPSPKPSLPESVAPRSRVRQDFAVSVGLATFLFFRLWSELLTPTPEDGFYIAPPRPVVFLALIINTLALGALFGCAVSLVRRYPKRWCRVLVYAVFVSATILSANAVRTIVARKWFWTGELACYAAVLVFAATFAFRPKHVARFAYHTFLVLSPLVLLVFGQAMWAMTHYDGAHYANGSPAPMLPHRPGAPRVVWMVFDEFDQHLGFDHRPAGLEMPALDRFRAEAVAATNAYSPHLLTRFSMLSLTTGKRVMHLRRLGPARLALQFENSTDWNDWTVADSVFRDAHRLGMNSAVVGWYLPYCRVINAELARCWFCEIERRVNSNGDTLPQLVAGQLRSLVESNLLSPFGQSQVVRTKVRHYTEMERQAVSVVSDPSIGLALLHMDVPHIPYIYNRRTHSLDLANSPVKGYIDNLALADLTFAEIRRSLEQAHLWDSTMVIVTSDHCNRDKNVAGTFDRRIPFMVKMPGQTAGAVFTQQINTVFSRQLIDTVLAGKIVTAADLVSWMSQHGSTVVPTFDGATDE